jgi:hypothetical protein
VLSLNFSLRLDDFKQEVGSELEHGSSDDSLLMWLRNIEHVEAKVRDGQMVFFSKAPEQSHLRKLFRQQTYTKVSRRPLKRQAQFSESVNTSVNTSVYTSLRLNTTPKTCANALLFRRNQLTKTAFRLNERFIDQSFEANQTIVGTMNSQLTKPEIVHKEKRFKSNLFERPDGSVLTEFDFNKNNNQISNDTYTTNISYLNMRQHDVVS